MRPILSIGPAGPGGGQQQSNYGDISGTARCVTRRLQTLRDGSRRVEVAAGRASQTDDRRRRDVMERTAAAAAAVAVGTPGS